MSSKARRIVEALLEPGADDYPEPDGPAEEGREVQIGSQILALIRNMRENNRPTHEEFDQIEQLATELVTMHGLPDADWDAGPPIGQEEPPVEGEEAESGAMCDNCGSHVHHTEDCIYSRGANLQ